MKNNHYGGSINNQETITTMSQSKFVFSIAIVGPQCTGKTSFLNALVGHEISCSDAVRNTYYPFCFEESSSAPSTMKVREEITLINKGHKSFQDNPFSFTVNECQLQKFLIPECRDLIVEDKLRNRLTINIYDIPGLDDPTAGLSDVYFQWLKQHIANIDVILYVESAPMVKNQTKKSTEILELLHVILQDSHQPRILIPILNKSNEVDAYEDFHNIIKEVFPSDSHIVVNHPIKTDIQNALIYRCVFNERSYDLVSEQIRDHAGLTMLGMRWKVSSSEQKREIFKGDLMANIEMMQESLKNISGFEKFLETFNDLLSCHARNILNHKKKREYDEFLAVINEENFDVVAGKFFLYFEEAINLATDMNLSCRVDLMERFSETMEKFQKSEIANICDKINSATSPELYSEITGRLNKFDQRLSFLQQRLSEIANNSQITTLLQGMTKTDIGPVLANGRDECKKCLTTLYSRLLLNAEFNPTNSQNCEQMKEIIQKQLDLDEEVVISFFAEKILSHVPSMVHELFFSENRCVIDLLSVFDNININGKMFALLVRIFSFRLRWLSEKNSFDLKNSYQMNFMDNYLTQFSVFLQGECFEIFRRKRLIGVLGWLSAQTKNLIVRNITEIPGMDQEFNVIEIEMKILKLIAKYDMTHNPIKDMKTDIPKLIASPVQKITVSKDDDEDELELDTPKKKPVASPRNTKSNPIKKK